MDTIKVNSKMHSQHLEIGYWNEYIKGDKIVFLFHLDNVIKRYEVENFENKEVLRLCQKLCECIINQKHIDRK